MTVQELIKTLQKVDANKQVVFYYAKNNDLQSCEYESLLDVDKDFVELTVEHQDIEED